jgi:hypothetical protein
MAKAEPAVCHWKGPELREIREPFPGGSGIDAGNKKENEET